jgi:hypothetical protein
MKKLIAALLGAALIVPSILGICLAETVTVSSFTALPSGAAATIAAGGLATRIVSSNSRNSLCIQNAGTVPVYYSKYSSSASVTAGMILSTATAMAGAYPDPVCLVGFSGALFGQSAAGSAGTVKYVESLK